HAAGTVRLKVDQESLGGDTLIAIRLIKRIWRVFAAKNLARAASWIGSITSTVGRAHRTKTGVQRRCWWANRAGLVLDRPSFFSQARNPPNSCPGRECAY